MAKHRNGALDNVRLRFVGEFARFENMNSFTDDMPISGNTNLNANTGFDGDNTMTYRIKSKMNDSGFGEDQDFDLNFNEDSPF